MNEKITIDKIANNIKRSRMCARLSQSELSKRCGVTIEAIRLIEEGNKWPSSDTLVKISVSLSRTVSELIGDSDYLIESKEKNFYIKFSEITELSDEDQALILLITNRLRCE